MKKIFACSILFCLLATSLAVTAQSKTVIIHGKITSFEESLPLEAVSIQIKGSSNNTGSQADGTFSLSISPNEKILVLYLAGYEKKEVAITNATEYDIVLKRSQQIFIKSNPHISAR